MIHELKICTDHFKAVVSGKKSFEVRKNDRFFHEGDLLALNEFDGQCYTGNSCLVYIDYILNDPDYCKKDMVVMSIKPCSVCIVGAPSDYFHKKVDYSVPLATISDAERELGGEDGA